jgi:hypothetical protein
MLKKITNKKSVTEFVGSRIFLQSSCLLIFLTSIFFRSLIDIGCDTGVYLNLGKKVAEGGRYYYEFFESNFPISFYFYALEYKLSEILRINPIFMSEIVINLLAILSIFWSSQILKRTTIYENKAHYNLIIIGYFLGFFLRPHALEIGEFGTKTSLLLIAFYPYISFSFARKNQFTKKELIWRGLLMGLIPCIKPHYLCLMIFVESYHFWQKKSLRFFYEFDKLVMYLVGIFYIFLMIKLTPEFFEFMVPMWSKTYSAYSDYHIFIENFWRHIASRVTVFAFVFLIFSRFKFSANDKILFCFYCGASLLIILENIATFDQVAVFYAVTTICFTKLLFDLLSSKQFSIMENKFISAVLVFLPIFDLEILPASIFGLGGFVNVWWLIILVYPFFFAKKLTTEQRRKFFSAQKIILFLFGYLTLLTTTILTLRYLGGWVYISVNLSILFVVLFFFEKKIYAKFFPKFSPFFVFVVLTSISCLLYTYIASAINMMSRDDYYSYPNKVSDFMTYYSHEYAPKKEDGITVFSTMTLHQFPLLNYLQKINYSKFHILTAQANQGEAGSPLIFPIRNTDVAFVRYYLFLDIVDQIKNDKVKVIFVNNSSNILNQEHVCLIGTLEYHFIDAEFKKLFFQNFHLVNHVIITKKVKPLKKLRFMTEEKASIFDQAKPTTVKIIRDYEVYVRNEKN